MTLDALFGPRYVPFFFFHFFSTNNCFFLFSIGFIEYIKERERLW
jgi:hypothetical protein